MASHRWRRGAVPVVAVLIGGGAVYGYGRLGPVVNAEPVRQSPVPTTTADVVVRDLRQTTKLNGRLGFGPASKLVSKTTGTLTTAPTAGAVVQAGEVLFRLDEQPVVLMEGSVPAWRSMTPDSSAGADIAQLEANLVGLGFDPDGEIEVDDTWNYATTAAVERWQKSLRMEQTGSVEFGRVVFGPSRLRLGARLVEQGTTVGPDAAVATYTATTPVVSIDLDAKKQPLVEVGKPATLTFADGDTTTGTVRDISKVVVTTEEQPGSPSSSTVAVTVALDDPSRARYDGAAVDVHVVTKERKAVKTVPVASLLALAEGGFGVEVVAEPTTRIVRVEPGIFADNLVEVVGDVAAGDKVVVPS